MSQISNIPQYRVPAPRTPTMPLGENWAGPADLFAAAVGRYPCTASITVSAETANVRTINIALLNASTGVAIDYVESFMLVVFSSADMTAFATGGSTGVAIGTNGALLALVAKKVFLCTTEADGTWDGTWTDTGTESVALAVQLPGGGWTISTAFANT